MEKTSEKIRLKAKAGCSLLAAMLLGASLLALAHSASNRSDREEAVDRILNQEGPIAPRWLRASQPCTSTKVREAAHDAAMANLASTFASDHSNAGLHYVVRYFGWQWSTNDNVLLNEPRRCPPAPQFYRRIAPILERADWLGPAQESNDLRLIERLPPSSYIASRIGVHAFDNTPVALGPLKFDQRPYLRMLLAYQGGYARPWAARALSAIAPDTKLGTSAAFLAVSTVPDRALPRVADAMRRFIAEARERQVHVSNENPPSRGFTIRDGDRLLELAYALSMAGPRAEPYSKPLIGLLDQKFGSGSHFGLLLLEPKSLCPVARHIGGRAAAAANAKPYCKASTKD